MPKTRLLFVSAVALFSACTGSVGPAPSGLGREPLQTPGAPASAETPSASCAAPLPLRRLRRLSRDEYRRAVDVALGVDPAALPGLAPLLDGLAEDEVRSDAIFVDHVRPVGDALVQQQMRIASLIAGAVRGRADVASRLAGGCTPALAESCLPTWLNGFGRRVLKRPLSPDERAAYQILFTSAAAVAPDAAMATVVRALLLHPAFLYHLELEGTERAGIRALTAFETAARVSFALTGGPPDDALLDAAANGRLQDGDGFRTEVERLLTSPAARRQMALFTRRWLSLDRDYDLSSLSPHYRAGLETAGLLAGFRRELEAFVNGVVFDQGGRFEDLVLSRAAYIDDPKVARVYGVTPGPDGAAALGPERAGLFSRAAFLVASSEHTNLILRGAFLRKHVLCDEVAPPPDVEVEDSVKELGDLSVLSGRQIAERLTAGASCSACHQLINPLGIVLESYDGLGRHRTREVRYDGSGKPLASHALDLTVPAAIDEPTGPVVTGPIALFERLATSPKAKACFVRRWLEFTQVEGAGDACRERALGAALDRGVLDLLRATAESQRALTVQP